MNNNEIYRELQDMPLVMTPMDVAKVLRISRNTAYEIVHSKGFPVFKVNNQYRIKRDKFVQWMDEAVVA